MLSVALAALVGLVLGRLVAGKRSAISSMILGALTLAMVAALLSFAAGSALHGDVVKRYPLIKLDSGGYVGLATTVEGVRKTFRYEDAGRKVDARADVTVVSSTYDAEKPYVIIHSDELKMPASLFALRLNTQDPEFRQIELHLPPDEFFDRGK